ncbi:class F sortase [Micromonospora sp. WMMD812]|uniref:class F sortase n=1 Tax=Micromonospora sp. WMMD812 TaxID=3015152 RepID=UPI00248CB193|nr:class F sortase [Micromonospora sp. WMMD812]WBB69837.1 class F sortase [Micromonospora sp. WMMD812]
MPAPRPAARPAAHTAAARSAVARRVSIDHMVTSQPAPPVRPAAGRPAANRQRRPGRSPWTVPLAVLLVLAGVFATGAGLGRTVGPLDWAAGGDRPPSSDSGAVRASRPVSLAVPTIGVAAPVAPVGQARDGSIAVPPLERHNETGWYDRGPVPGEPGPAVIVGHVDTKSGPSVFYDLGKLKPGDTIEVTRADKSVVTFRVDSVEHFPKDQFPADRIYGHEGPPGLRLITCGGNFVGGGTGYLDNVIAFASLTTTRTP